MKQINIKEALVKLKVFSTERKKIIHTFENSYIGLMGCYMELFQLKKEMKQTKEIYLTEEIYNHNIAYKRPNGVTIYLNTI